MLVCNTCRYFSKLFGVVREKKTSGLPQSVDAVSATTTYYKYITNLLYALQSFRQCSQINVSNLALKLDLDDRAAMIDCNEHQAVVRHPCKPRQPSNLQGGPFLYALTLSNINRFSKLFHCQNQEKICN